MFSAHVNIASTSGPTKNHNILPLLIKSQYQTKLKTTNSLLMSHKSNRVGGLMTRPERLTGGLSSGTILLSWLYISSGTSELTSRLSVPVLMWFTVSYHDFWSWSQMSCRNCSFSTVRIPDMSIVWIRLEQFNFINEWLSLTMTYMSFQ